MKIVTFEKSEEQKEYLQEVFGFLYPWTELYEIQLRLASWCIEKDVEIECFCILKEYYSYCGYVDALRKQPIRKKMPLEYCKAYSIQSNLKRVN